MSDAQTCGEMRVCLGREGPSAEIVHVGRANVGEMRILGAAAHEMRVERQSVKNWCKNVTP